MKIGILQVGRAPEQLRMRHGDYDEMFTRLLAKRGFDFDSYAIMDGKFPESTHDAEGWLITGSKFGVYEDHSWIAPLEDFLREAYHYSIPIVGVCFGHQILAKALGGTVQKFEGGWSVGAVDYDVQTKGKRATLNAWHQDQVIVVPEQAEVIGRTDFCQYAMLSYGDRALTVQPHPEFTAEYLADLIEVRRDMLPGEIITSAVQRLDAQLDGAAMAEKFETFFKKKRVENNYS